MTHGPRNANAQRQLGERSDEETSAPILPTADAARKRQAHLQATAALHGIALHRLDNGGWLASRWNLTRELGDHEVEAWLRGMGVGL